MKNRKNKRLSGFKVLITGASSGLGLNLAMMLAEEDASIIAVGRNEKSLQDLCLAIQKVGGEVSLVSIDLSKAGTIEELSKKISEKFNDLDVLIHCAMSTLPMMPITQVSLKEIETSLLSPITISFRLISCFNNLLKNKRQGLFIYISDQQKIKFNGPYNSAKRACDQLFKSYQEENKRLGLTVLIEHPSPMNTRLRNKLYPGETKITQEAIKTEAKKIKDKILRFTEAKGILT